MCDKKRDVGFEIRSLSNLIRRHVDNSAARAEVDSITGTNGWVIIYLVHHMNEDVYQRDLEQTFSVRRSTMSNILSLMDKKGLVKRESVEHDARLKKIVLTEKAISLYEMMENDRINTEAILKDGVADEDLAVFMRVAEKMRENMEKADGPCDHMPHLITAVTENIVFIVMMQITIYPTMIPTAKSAS